MDPEAGPSSALRSTRRSNRSIYITPSTSTHQQTHRSLGKRLIVRRLDHRKGKRPANQLGDLDDDEAEHDLGVNDVEEVEAIREAQRERSRRGWKRRRETEELRSQVKSDGMAPSIGMPKNLPGDDLLNAIQQRASSFYTSHSLLLEPKRQTRARQWGSKKRMYLQQEGVAPIDQRFMDKYTWEQEHLRPIRKRRVMNAPTVAGSESASGDESLSDEDEAEDEDDDEDEHEHEHEHEGGEGNGDEPTHEDEGHDPPTGEGGSATKRKGKTVKIRGVKYKKRDMYKSLDGSALIAMGFLIDRFIARGLQKAGYMEGTDRRSASSEDEEGEDQT